MTAISCPLFAVPFAMLPQVYSFLFNTIGIQSLFAAISDDEDDDYNGTPAVDMTEDGIACISVIGAITKYGCRLLGPATIEVAAAIREAAEDPGCKGIMIISDSAGGSSDGVEALAGDIVNARNSKPVFCFIDGMATAAAYWAVSQCDKVIASPSSIVGSIGTFQVMYDQSQNFTDRGIKTIVIRAGDMKGTGTPGEEISDERIADRSRMVNHVNDLFVSRVASGRKISTQRARELADGRVHVGEQAKSQGMVDQIGNYDEAMAGLRLAIAKR